MSDRQASGELFELVEHMVEGLLSADDLVRLEQMILGSPELAAQYADYVSMHATLLLDRGMPLKRPLPTELSDDDARVNVVLDRSGGGQRDAFAPADRAPHFAVAWLSYGLAAAVMLIGGLAFFTSGGGWFLPRSQIVATLSVTQGCKWDAGTLPTEVGAKLTAGRLRLAEGLATIEFINGVKICLEGPADVELVSPMLCIMNAGQLIAHVPPEGQGFVVETPTSVLTDFGTEFGVAVNHGADAVVQVFKGRVDALHRESGHTEQLLEGETFEFRQAGYSSLSPGDEHVMPTAASTTQQPNETADWIHISTAQGRGRDAFVQPMPIPADRRSESLLLVKQPTPDMPQWERRVYMGFDLASVSGKNIAGAELTLTFAPTGFGFAALVPDATFEVYGVSDESLDDWDERELMWDNAPANPLTGPFANSRQCKLLGSFILLQGEQSATCNIRGAALTEFLNADTNQLVTLIVIRKTPGTGRSDLVHGIVSRRHPSLSPPTLRLHVLGH